MEKVWNPNENDLKILEYLYDHREGSRANSIKKYQGFKHTSTLYKRLNILKDKTLILNESQVWKLVNGEIKFVESLLKRSKNKIFELHHPAYVVKLPEVPKWWNPIGTQMKNRLMMIKGYQFQRVDFGKNNSNPFIQLKNERFVIQMYPEAVIVIHRKRYLSYDNPYDLTIDFMNDFYDLWEWFEEKMKFRFFKDGVPQMTLRGHDYNRINDWMANYVIKKVKHKVLIKIGDGRHVWFDLSDPLGREADTPEIQEILERDIKDKVLNKPMLNSELQMAIQNVTENQEMFAKNMESHIKAIQDLGAGVRKLTKVVGKIKEIKKELKEGKQTTLNEF